VDGCNELETSSVGQHSARASANLLLDAQISDRFVLAREGVLCGLG